MSSDKLKTLIAIRAYEFWEQEDHHHGQDQMHWLRAEKEITNAQQNKEDLKSSKETSHKREPGQEEVPPDDKTDEQNAT